MCIDTSEKHCPLFVAFVLGRGVHLWLIMRNTEFVILYSIHLNVIYIYIYVHTRIKTMEFSSLIMYSVTGVAYVNLVTKYIICVFEMSISCFSILYDTCFWNVSWHIITSVPSFVSCLRAVFDCQTQTVKQVEKNTRKQITNYRFLKYCLYWCSRNFLRIIENKICFINLYDGIYQSKRFLYFI